MRPGPASKPGAGRVLWSSIVTRLLTVVAAALWLAGCLAVKDVPRYKSEGVAQTYPVTLDEAWTITQSVFRWGGATEFEEHRAEGYMLTSAGGNLHGHGTIMGAWLEPVDRANTRVLVVMKQRLRSTVVFTINEATFHRRFAETVQALRAEQPLPPAPAR